MAETTILLNGFSVLCDPHINVDPNGGNLGEGAVTVTGGDMVFEADDIIVMEVINAGADGSVDGSSEITRILVYDNATDYFNNTVLYTYEGNNPNQTGTIPSNNNSVGDRFLRINANVLNSSDPGAPDINHLFIAAGTDLSDVAAVGSLTIDQFQDTDYDQDTVIDTGTPEVADGVFHGGDDFNNSLVVLCFARGTLIETSQGPRYIETLKEGDLVTTLDAGPQPIRWISGRRMQGTGPKAPIRIQAGALGNIRDLWVSQNHRMLVRRPETQFYFGESEVLVAAKHLVDGETITFCPCPEVEYFHFLLDGHHIVFAEGCPAESLYPGEAAQNGFDAEERDELLAEFPELANEGSLPEIARYPLRSYEAALLLAA